MMQTFSAAVEAIYAAGLDQTLWANALELIARAVGGHGTLFGINGGGATQFFAYTGYEQAAIDSFALDYADKSYVWSLVPATTAGEIIHDRHVLLPDRRRSDPFANEWATRYDTADCVVLPLVKRTDVSAVAVVARPVTGGAFGAQELLLLKMLVPHLQRAVDMNQRLDRSAWQTELALDILDRFRDSLVLVTADGTVTYTNKAAEALFRDRDSGLSIVRSRVACQQPGDTAVLRRMIGEAAGAGDRAARSAGTVSLQRDAHLWPLTVHCLPLTHPRRWTLERQPTVLLLITDTARSIDLAPAMLAELFRFTGAEARLAAHLARGDTLADVADALGVSRATLASQLHAIFQKTHTSRQSDLVRLLHALPRLDFGTANGESGQG